MRSFSKIGFVFLLLLAPLAVFFGVQWGSEKPLDALEPRGVDQTTARGTPGEALVNRIRVSPSELEDAQQRSSVQESEERDSDAQALEAVAEPYDLDRAPFGYPFDPRAVVPVPPVSLTNIGDARAFREAFSEKESSANPAGVQIDEETAAMAWAGLELERAMLRQAADRYHACYRAWRDSITKDSSCAVPFKTVKEANDYLGGLFPGFQVPWPRLTAVVSMEGQFLVGVADAEESLDLYLAYKEYVFMGEVVAAKLRQDFGYH